jgi:hypothetical protein
MSRGEKSVPLAVSVPRGVPFPGVENLAAASATSSASPATAVEPGAVEPDQLAPEVLDDTAARRAFSTSILISATRCLLTYIVLPFVAPALGIAADVGPGLGIAIGLVAIGSNVLTIRRFHRADHRWRWGYTAIALAVIGMLSVLMVQDVATLVT